MTGQGLIRFGIFFIVAVLPTLTLQNEYCKISRQHTLCKFQGIGPRCKTPYERGIPRQDRELIMELHNSLRMLVATGNERRGRPGPQPTASNMKQMVWDDELAASAQRLADQCKYTHDCLECRKVSRFLTGQNLYQFSENIVRQGSNWNQAIRAWYDEVADWSPRHIDKFHFIKPLGHYTQMLWADTDRVGCGYAYFNDGKWNRKLYICNYGPAGNIITTQMYKQGQPCSECPEGSYCSNQYPGLCSAGSGGIVFPTQPRLPVVTPPPTTPRPVVTYAPTTPPTTTTRRTTTTTTTTTTTPRPTTTTRRTTTTTPPPPPTKSSFTINEIESNDIDIGFRNFRGISSFPNSQSLRKNYYNVIDNTQTFPTTTTRRSYNHHYNFFDSTSTNPPATTSTASPSPLVGFNRFRYNYYTTDTATNPTTTTQRYFFFTTPTTTTTTTTTRPTTTPTTTTTMSTTTTRRSISFSPRIYPKRTEKEVRQQKQSQNLVTAKSENVEEQRAYLTVTRQPEAAVNKIANMNSILLYCDFDFAKCPIRFTGDNWNYTQDDTPGYGRGFETIIPKRHLTNLYIRSIMYPQEDGNICLSFRFVNYQYNPFGGPLKSTGAGAVGPDGKPLSLRVTAGTLKQKPKIVEITEKSSHARDWLTAKIQFQNLRSMFLLIFQLPSNFLQDNVYLAIDDVLVTQGFCQT